MSEPTETPPAPSASEILAAASETQRQVLSAVSDVQAKLTEISSIASQAVAAKTQISDAQAVIATKSDHIQSAQEHADKVRGELDRALTSATQQANDAEGHKTRAQSAGDDSTVLLGEIRATKTTSEQEAAAAAASRKIADDSATITSSLADKSKTIEQRIADYEKQLADLRTQSEDQLRTIVALLPGATAAGLAHAFDVRRKSFSKPYFIWQCIFVGAVLVIVGLTVSGLWHVITSGATPTYDELLRLWLSRLPVVAALVWLALHASHESALAKRLEEDYGYKSAIATCFEGFKRQVSDIHDASPDSALAKLLNNTLETIAAPPGRIYDKHALAATPSKETAAFVKSAADSLKASNAKPGTPA